MGHIGLTNRGVSWGCIGAFFSACFGMAAFAASAVAADFAIRDGDTVVFLGDSITAARTYGKIIEDYTLLRYPTRKVRFINAGRGGDTAAGGLSRLDNDVFSRGATVLTVAYGINDIGWGMKADAEHRQKYLDATRGIVEACKQRHVRVFICSAAITGGDKDDGGFLQKMCDDGMAVSRSLGEGAIDVQRTMREILKRVRAANAQDPKNKDTLHAPDGIHLSDLGQLAMAFAILKGLGAPADVSAVSIDAQAPAVLEMRGCQVSALRGSENSLEFDRLDEGLPLNLEPLWALQFRYIPVPEELNRYMLTVKNLRPGKYDLTAAGRRVGTFTEKQLDAGVNLSSATPDGWVPGGPWDAQAHLVKKVTEARDELRVVRFLSADFLRNNPSAETAATETTAADRDLEMLQRTLARPAPYRFVIRPVTPASRPGAGG